MSNASNRAKHAAKTPPKTSRRGEGPFDSILLIRLVIAVVIFAVAMIVKTSAVIRVILLILSALAAGYDIFLDAVNAVEDGKYFSAPLIVGVVAVIGFIVGFPGESAAMVILHQIGALLVSYASKRTRASALAFASEQEPELAARAREYINTPDAGELRIAKTMEESAGLILRIAMIFAVLYAILLPLFTAFPFRVSIHRALMIFLVATPASMLVAMPLAGLVGLGFSAKKGILFRRAATLEKMKKINLAIFDQAGVFSDDCPEVLAVQSSILDRDTFMNFAAHAAYYSEQPFAKAISNVFNQEYKLEVVSDFKDIPGYGVELTIGNSPVLLATAEYMSARGVSIPQDPNDEGLAYYLIIAGRYIGKIIISQTQSQGTDQLAAAMKKVGVRDCVLLTEGSKEESQKIANELGFPAGVSAADTPERLAYISQRSQGTDSNLLYVYANGFEQHSDAAVDIRVSTKGKYADAIVIPDQLANLPEAVSISKRMHTIAVENAVFAFCVKAILIFLSILGLCTLWFAVFLDVAASLATILNTIRITKAPKFFQDDDEEDEEDD